MEHDDHPEINPGSLLYLEAKAIARSVAIIRKAQGKSSARDFPVGSDEWGQAYLDFANDLLVAIRANQDGSACYSCGAASRGQKGKDEMDASCSACGRRGLVR